ncbi:MAG: lactonase family protein [Gemmataceae bacterium]
MLLSRFIPALISGALIAPFAAAEQPTPAKAWVFLGTYTGPKSKGIYRCEIDLKTGELTKPELAAEVKSPSFLAIHPTNKFLYAVSEVDKFRDNSVGCVNSFSLDATSGDLKLLGQESSGGSGPCHLVVDRTGQNVMVANYGGGSVMCLRIKPDGTLALASFHQHEGKGTNPQRQEGPHAHSINVDANNRFAVAADLGLDKLFVYKLDAARHALMPNNPPSISTAPGSGPRHFAFHPNGKFAYVINEMALTVNAMRYDSDKGTLEIIQTISTVPTKATPEMSTAEVQVHPSGKFLYGSNRGHNSIAVFKIEPETGMLTAVQNQAEGIKTPRNFGIDPTGRFLLVANQDGDSVVVFRIDADTGELKPTGYKIEVGSPVCVKFVPQGK